MTRVRSTCPADCLAHVELVSASHGHLDAVAAQVQMEGQLVYGHTDQGK